MKKPREEFLVLEAHPARTAGFLLAVDDDRAITLEKQWADFPVAKFLKRREKMKNIPWLSKKMRVIVSADPALAATLSLPVSFEHKGTETITVTELENLFGQAIGKVFAEYRKEAAAHLKTDELHTILVSNRVTDYTVDGREHKTVWDTKGRRIRAVLELTFTTRGVFDPWKNLFNAPDDFFFTETARAELHALRRIAEMPAVSLVVAGPERAFAFYAKSDASILRRADFDWVPGGFASTIGQATGVGPAVADQMYAEYLGGKLSPAAARHFDRMLAPHSEHFAKEARKHKLAKPLFIDSYLQLPDALHAKAGISAVPLAVTLAKAGFIVDVAQWGMSEAKIFRMLAPFFEFYFDRTDSPLNHKLRRRLHWLGSGS